MRDIDEDLQRLGERLVGNWKTEATHPMRPGVTVRGSANFEWMDGKKFLIGKSENDNPEFPDGIVVIGNIDGLK